MVGAVVVAATGVLVLLPEGLETDGRLALFGFVLATVLWTASPLSPAYVALIAAAVVTIPAGDQELLLGSLGHDVVWLIVGAFVLGGALQATGLAVRFVHRLVSRARTVSGLAWLLTAALLPLSFVVPSTSGRAAVMLPVHRGLSAHLGSPRTSRMLAVLIPCVVLVSTTATLVGATSHLVAVDLLEQATGDSISFLQWAVWGVPFAIAASAVTCLAVLRLSLSRQERRVPVTGLAGDGPGAWSRGERVAGTVLAASLALWLTEPVHGVGIATVTVVAALVLTAPGVGVTSWQDGLRHVSWNVVLFVAGALVLGQALVDSGAGAWVVEQLIAVSGLHGLTHPVALVVVLSLLAVTTHLYVTSHTVRAVTIVPPLLAATAPLDLSPVAVVFLVTIGIDYCLTMPVSSKALLVFAEAGGHDAADEGLRASDLLRLSAVLLPAFVALMVVTYLVWWQWTGLAL